MNDKTSAPGDYTGMPDDFVNFLIILRDTQFALLALMVNPEGISEERRKGIAAEITVVIDQIDAILARGTVQ